METQNPRKPFSSR